MINDRILRSDKSVFAHAADATWRLVRRGLHRWELLVSRRDTSLDSRFNEVGHTRGRLFVIAGIENPMRVRAQVAQILGDTQCSDEDIRIFVRRCLTLEIT